MKIAKATEIKRNKIFYEVWQKYKAEITMDELSTILNISLNSLYRILAKEKSKVVSKNSLDLWKK